MKTLNLFPVELYEFRNENLACEKIISILQSLDSPTKTSSNLSYTQNVHNLKDLSEVWQWVNDCLETIRISKEYQCDKFEVTSSWFNKSVSQQGMCQNYHRHTMSFFSGILYLTEGTPTVFEDAVFQRASAQIEVLRKNYLPFEKIEAEPGKLILFPSWLYHQSPPHFDNFDRWVISFNSLPTGKINEGCHDASCYISVRES